VCSRVEADGARKAWFEMNKSMRPAGPGKAGKFAEYSCCYGCFVTQAMCQKWQRQEGQCGRWKSTSRACQFSDIIMPVVVCMFRSVKRMGRMYYFGQKVIWVDWRVQVMSVILGVFKHNS
jgi:hypothetical protein